DEIQMRCVFQPPSDGHDAIGSAEVHVLPGLTKRRLRHLSDIRGLDRRVHEPDGRRGAACGWLWRPKPTDLKRDEMRRRSLDDDIGGNPALKHGPGESPGVAVA